VPGWLRVFSFADGPGLPPCRQRRVPLRRVAQSAASGQRPGAFPFAGWLGVSSYLWPEVAPCRWLRVTPSPRARGIPLPGWFRASPRQWLEDARCRVARGCPRAGWRRVSSSPVAPGLPGTSGPGIPLRRVAPGSPRAKARGFPLPGGAGFSPGQGPGNFPFAGWLRTPSGRDLKPPFAGAGSGVSPFASGSGFPLRRLPFPVVEKFLRLPPRAAQEVSASNFKILWLSTSRPQLTLSCPPRRTLLHRILHSPVHRLGGLCTDGYFQPSAGYRPANLISGSLASLT
jgi:hypothetical protein